MNINERVQLLRKSLNLTQKEFGEKIRTYTNYSYIPRKRWIHNKQ